MDNEKMLTAIKDEIALKMKGTPTRDEIGEIEKKVADLITKIDADDESKVKTADIAKMQEQLDALDTKYQKQIVDNKSFAEKVAADIREKLKPIVESGDIKGGTSFVLPYTASEIKAVGSMLVSSHTTNGNSVPKDFQPDILKAPYRLVRMRQLLPIGQTVSDTVRYIKKENKEGAIATRAEGAKKSQIDWEYNAADAVVRSIAGFLKISREMLSDMPYLQSELTTDLIEELRDVEDTQILTGDNQNANLNGIITQAASGNAYDAASLVVNPATYYDILSTGIAQIAVANYMPNVILLNPADAAKMRLEKGTDGHYLHPRNEPMSVDGVPIVVNTAITAGTFLIGDFVRGAKVFEREGVKVSFHEEDDTNVQYNLVTVRVEERVTLAVKHVNAFVTATFGAALATLSGTTSTTA